MKRIVKGYFIWILNNTLLLAWLMVAKEIHQEKSNMSIIAVIVIALLWFATGQLIVAAFTVEKIEYVYSAPTEIAKEIPCEKEKEENIKQNSKKYFFDSEIYGTIFKKTEQIFFPKTRYSMKRKSDDERCYCRIQKKENIYMNNGNYKSIPAQKAFPATIRGVKRGDIYYADLGSVEDAAVHQMVKKRPVLIIQNNLSNKKSPTTICLCLTTKCKYGLPYHVHFNDLNIVSRESDICAEHIKTIDKSRLEQYLGNVGKEVMEQVDKALIISLGINEAFLSDIVSIQDLPELEKLEVIEEPQASVGIFQYMGEQLRFWQDIEVKISLIKTEIKKLDDEINSIMNYIEETNYNVAQGYKVYKVLRDKQAERKTLVKEVICMESIIEQVDTEKMVQSFRDSIKLSDEKIKQANKITFVKELMEEDE